MNKLLLTILLAASCSVITGCASGRVYFADRGRDAADIFTISVQKGIGVDAQISFITPAAGLTETLIGLEDGRFVTNPISTIRPFHDSDSGSAVLGLPLLFTFKGVQDRWDTVIENRNKSYQLCLLLGFIPFEMKSSDKITPHYLTKVEVGASLFYGIRVGVNPGEFVDFLLGWFGVDMFGDDYGARKRKKHAEYLADPTSEMTRTLLYEDFKIAVPLVVEAVDRLPGDINAMRRRNIIQGALENADYCADPAFAPIIARGMNDPSLLVRSITSRMLEAANERRQQRGQSEIKYAR